jgi:hypothetical protein
MRKVVRPALAWMVGFDRGHSVISQTAETIN